MIDISAYSNPISVGGIVGTGVPHTIDSCINYGTVSARAYGGVVEVGGILGSTSTSAYQASINKSVNYGIITAIATSRPMTSSFTGGIIGRIQAKEYNLVKLLTMFAIQLHQKPKMIMVQHFPQ